MKHKNEIEAEIYQLERELETQRLNDNEYEVDCLVYEINNLKSDLESLYWE